MAYAAYVGLLGAVITCGFEAGTSRPFLVLGAVLVPSSLSRGSGAPLRLRRRSRASRAPRFVAWLF